MAESHKVESERLVDIIKKRRSCRFFKPGIDVPDHDINIILEAARWAPSARNIQPIEFVVARDQAKRDKLSEFSRQMQPSDAPVSIIVIGDLKRAETVGEISPHDTTTSIKGIKRFLYMDASAAIQNMLLMAEALGHSSLWIGSFDEDALEEYMGLPDRFITISIICIGAKSNEIQVPPKRVLKTRVHREVWEAQKQDETHLGFSRKINVKF